MFIPSENRERAAMFNLAVETAHEALTHPGVAERLGSLVTDLEVINKTAFLPDYRSGRFHTPPSYKNEPSVALIPVPDNVFESGDLYRMVEPIFDHPIGTWPFATAFVSKTYDLDLTQEAHALIASQGSAVDPLLTESDAQGNLEAFTWHFNTCLERQRLYVLSRPVIMMRFSTLMQEGSELAAAAAIHEQSHALDLLTEGPMYGLLKFAVASELRANHADHSVLAGQGVQCSDIVTTVEDLRLLENASASNPFRPTDRLVDSLLRGGFL